MSNITEAQKITRTKITTFTVYEIYVASRKDQDHMYVCFT